MIEDEFEAAKKENNKRFRICGTIDFDLYKRFDKYCEDGGYDRSKLLELIIKKFMDVKDGNGE